MKKLILILAVATVAFQNTAFAEIARHFNMAYTTDTHIPVNINDRYYSQDLGRDHWYVLDRAGAEIRDLVGLDKFILSGASVTQIPITDRIVITSGTVYVPYNVTTPLLFTTQPPTVSTQDVTLVRVDFSSFSYDVLSGTIPAALSLGSTNFVKIQYYDAPAATRSYAIRTGTYYYEMASSWTITVDTYAPTKYQVVLANVISSGTHAPMTITLSSRTASFFPMMSPGFFVNSITVISSATLPARSISTNTLDNGAVTTVKIASQAVTNITTGQTGLPVGAIDAPQTQVAATTITVSAGNSVFVIGCGSVGHNDVANHSRFTISLSRDGSFLSNGSGYWDDNAALQFTTPACVISMDYPPAGQHWYGLNYQVPFGTDAGTPAAAYNNIIAIEIKR